MLSMFAGRPGLVLLVAISLAVEAAHGADGPVAASPLPEGAIARFGSDRYRGTSDGGVIFLPGSRTIVTNSGFCDAATGIWKRRFPEGHDTFHQIALSPKGDRFATLRSEFDATRPAQTALIEFWSFDGALLSTIRMWEQQDRADFFAFLPDGDRIVTLGAGRVQVREASSGAVIKSLEVESKVPKSVAVSPNGELIALGMWWDLHFWEWQADKPAERIEGIKRGPIAACFSPDGKLLAGEHGFLFGVSLIDVSSRKVARSLWREGTSADSINLTFSADGSRLFAPTFQDGVEVWNVATGAHERTIPANGVNAKAVAISSDGRWAATGGNFNASIGVWETTDWKPLHQLAGHQTRISACAFSRDGSQIATAGQDQTIRLWEAGTGRELGAIGDQPESVSRIEFSPNGSQFASMSSDGSIRLWDAVSHEALATMNTGVRGGGGRSAMSFSEDGVTLMALGSDQVLRTWNLRSKAVTEIKLPFPGQGLGKGEIQPTITADVVVGSQRVFAATHNTCRVADAVTGELVREIRWTGIARRGSVSPDGKRFAVILEGPPKLTPLPEGGERHESSKVHTLEVFDVEKSASMLQLKLPDCWYPNCQYSPDGRKIAVACPGPAGPLLVLDAENGEELSRIPGHDVGGFAMCFSPDGSHLVTSSKLGVATLWDLSRFAAGR